MGCICGCHDKLDKIGVRGCCFKCEADHDPLRNALGALRVCVERLEASQPPEGGATAHTIEIANTVLKQY